MSRTITIKCDAPDCDERDRYKSEDDKSTDGWIEVWEDENTVLDFCSKSCMIDHYYPDEEDDGN